MMDIPLVLTHYFIWHYTRAFADLVRIWQNIVWFVVHFFSLPVLFRTFFRPFRRMGEQGPAHFDPAGWIAARITNTILRIVGMLVRSLVIFVGVVALALVLAAGPVAIAFWFVSPFFAIFLFSVGALLIIR